ncbi:MAG: hypothetical protein ACR2PG_19535 [Hyphomicrobiaceae bacterium]
MHVVPNLIIFVMEGAVIVMLSVIAFRAPFTMAAVTAGLTLTLGAYLEWLRYHHDISFFHRDPRVAARAIFASITLSTEVIVKTAIAGVAILFTFAGHEQDRLFVSACVFGACLFVGTGLLRRFHMSLSAKPWQWGYFRLALPLGLLFSLLLHGAVQIGLVSVASPTELASTIVFDLPNHPTLEQLSELTFNAKQIIDALLADLAIRLLGESIAPLALIVVSANLLMGLPLALYATTITNGVLAMEAFWFDRPT